MPRMMLQKGYFFDDPSVAAASALDECFRQRASWFSVLKISSEILDDLVFCGVSSLRLGQSVSMHAFVDATDFSVPDHTIFFKR